MAKYKEKTRVLSQSKIASDVYSIWLETKDIACDAKPGQFVSVYSNDGTKLLPRPISICEVNSNEGILRLVYRVVGVGTKEFSKYKSGDTVEVLGPLGNGFPLSNHSAILIGGGIGIPPMLELSKNLSGKKQIILGYKDELFLNDELSQYGYVYVSTEDGSRGVRGNVIDTIKANRVTGDVIYACGPAPMLKAVKSYAEENNIKAWLSLEEKMACGVGACLACVCKTKEIDEHSNVYNARVCKEGPVFSSEEVEL